MTTILSMALELQKCHVARFLKRCSQPPPKRYQCQTDVMQMDRESFWTKCFTMKFHGLVMIPMTRICTLQSTVFGVIKS